MIVSDISYFKMKEMGSRGKGKLKGNKLPIIYFEPGLHQLIGAKGQGQQNGGDVVCKT